MESFFLEPLEKHMELTENINSTTQSLMGSFWLVFEGLFKSSTVVFEKNCQDFFRIKVTSKF